MQWHGRGRAAKIEAVVSNAKPQISAPAQQKPVAGLERIIQLVLLAKAAAMIQIALENLARDSFIARFLLREETDGSFRSGPCSRNGKEERAGEKQPSHFFHRKLFAPVRQRDCFS